MNLKLAKFSDLVPSKLPFVEGKLEGHKNRKNYSIVGPGVAEDISQSVKISRPHSFNLGAVSAMPRNGSGLHSHTTAEVFIIFSGKWRFYWGNEGKDETILGAGDIISMPTNMFRGFENAGDQEGTMFVVLGGDDPGIITWLPSVLEKAKKTGMALLNDNTLIDLSKNNIPKDKTLLNPISSEEIKQFDNYNERYKIKPGITGWAQVNYPYGASMNDSYNKLSYDLYYIYHYSILLDLLIIIKTIRMLIRAKGTIAKK